MDQRGLYEEANLQTPTEFMSTFVAPNLFAGGTLHYIQCLRWLKDRGNSWHLSLTKNSWQLIMLRGIAWLAQLKRWLVKAYQICW